MLDPATLIAQAKQLFDDLDLMTTSLSNNFACMRHNTRPSILKNTPICGKYARLSASLSGAACP
jgi:hypothetical protein